MTAEPAICAMLGGAAVAAYCLRAETRESIRWRRITSADWVRVLFIGVTDESKDSSLA